MKELASRIEIGVLVAVLAWSLMPHDAHAYLDPGTGSYIFQIIIAALMGALFMLRVFWARITGFFGKRFSGSEEAGSSLGGGRETSLSTSEGMEPPALSPGQPPPSEQDDN